MPEVVVQPNPVARAQPFVRIDYGLTVAEIVERCRFPAPVEPLVAVFIGDVELPREHWSRTRPKVGAHVQIAVIPQGGGGEGGKNLLTAVAALAIAVASAGFGNIVGTALFNAAGAGALGATAIGSTTLAAVVGSTVISLTGALILNAIVGPPNSARGAGSPLSPPAFSVMGSSNRANPYGLIPRVFGRRRVFPQLAAAPYTEVVGSDQYLRMLLMVGHGPIKISDIRIGETPITSYRNVEVEVSEGGPTGWAGIAPITLYTNAVAQEDFSVLLTTGQWNSRFSNIEASEISLDITFPGGLANFDSRGNRSERTVQFAVEWRAVGAVGWTQATRVDGRTTLANAEWATTSTIPVVGFDSDTGLPINGEPVTGWIDERFQVRGASSSAVRAGVRIRLPSAGQYEVRVQRVSGAGGTQTVDQAVFTALRSIIYRPAINEPGLALIAIRIRATEQLNGTPQQINCLAESYLPTWAPGTGWTWAISRNPAWAYVDLLRRRGQQVLIDDSRLDLPSLRAWALACAQTAPNANEPRWAFDGVIEDGSVFEALNLVASHGRASFGMRDGRYSVVRDDGTATVVQHITPRNSWGYRGRKQFLDLPDALRVRFVNAEKGYQEDERVVFADGFNVTNARRFEQIELLGCTSQAQAWREGRYYLAVGELRPEEHTVSMDIENLRAQRGDLVWFAHDVIAVGLAQARILSRVTSGANTVGFVLDSTVLMEAGKTYGLRVRLADGGSAVLTLATTPGETQSVTLASPVLTAAATTPASGDLALFGEATREAARMLIKRIEPGPDLTAVITLLDAQDGVWSADTGPVPAFQTNITLQDFPQNLRPATPTITVRSDESVLLRLADGTLQDRIGVFLSPAPASQIPATGYEVQWRESASLVWRSEPRLAVDTPAVFLAPVVAGTEYDVRIRAVSEAGMAGRWETVLRHVVVGKTTRPGTVENFSGEARADGVQLSWEFPSGPTDVDVVAFEIRRGTAWDSGELVTTDFAGTSLFVAFSGSGAEQFLIKAIDVTGLQSQTAAALTSQATAPANVQRLDVYPQDDRVRLTWTEVPGSGVLYEIREGASWALGRFVARASGTTTLVQWPLQSVGDRTWWIRAFVPATGLYSPLATFATVNQAPIANRNVVIERDFLAAGFPGALHRLTRSAGVLVLDQVGGANVAAGEYFGEVLLDQQWYARNWIEMRANSLGGASLPWSAATFAWADAGGATWSGQLNDATGAELFATIFPGGFAEAGLVEGWPLNGSTVGLNGTPGIGTATYAEGHYRLGEYMDDDTVLDWTVAIPAQFSATFDLRLTTLRETFVVFLTLTGSGVRLEFGYDPASGGRFFVRDGAGNRINLVVPRELGDVITFGFNQSAGQRTLLAATRRQPAVVQAQGAFAPVGALTGVALYDTQTAATTWGNAVGNWTGATGASTWAALPGRTQIRATISDLAIWSTQLTDFAARIAAPRPLGCAPGRPFQPGDYRYQQAVVGLRLEDDARTTSTLSITQARVVVDVPDVVDRGQAFVPIAGLLVPFSRPFSAPPEVQAVQVGGTQRVLIEVSTITPTGFFVRVFDAADPALSAVGTISWSALGR